MMPPLTRGRSVRALRGFVLRVAGGTARARVVLTLAAVLGLNGADTAAISATTGNLEHAFHIGNTRIGVLVSVVALTGAVFTLPAGILADRVSRTRLLAISVTAWALATLVSGAATSYLWLLLARVGLGAVAAVTGPAVASLTGDFFPAGDRGRMYGLILSGELAGTGLGFVVSGDISSVLSWRFAFWWLVIPGLALAWLVWRLAEPARGGQSRLPAGAQQLGGGTEDGGRDTAPGGDGEPGGGDGEPGQQGLAGRMVRDAQVPPHRRLVLHTDPTGRSLWWAVRYVLRVRTNVIIIIASALGYFFFAGLRSFAIIFVTGHYGLSKAAASPLVLVIGIGAVAGVIMGGRLADRLLRRGVITARVLVPGLCLLAITPVLAPAIVTTSLALAVPLLTLGAALLGAANPPMDAARLDIMHYRLWGRAEGVRSFLRTLGEAAAPALFGYVSQHVFGGPAGATGGGGQGGAQAAGSAAGLEYTFLVFLIPLLLAGLLALTALRTYPRDVATAAASDRAIRGAPEQRR
jgi:MFS family permease